MQPPLTIIDIRQEVAGAAGASGALGGVAGASDGGVRYFNDVLTGVNDHVIRVSVMTQPYFWHLHPNSDETFLVVEGSVLIDLEDRMVELLPGQLFTIPRNVKHRTRPGGDRSVNITIEKADLQTIKLE